MLTEQTIVTNPATKGKAIKNADPSGMKVCGSVPGEQRSSIRVPDAGEGYLEGMDAEGNDRFQLSSGYHLQQGGP